MTDKRAINVIKAIKDYYNDKSEYYEDGYIGFDKEDNEAIDLAIKALEQQPRWIPVYEKLPEQEGWYLISLGGKTYGGADVDMYCKGWVKYGTHVLAWMPLPEPYEESEEKE